MIPPRVHVRLPDDDEPAALLALVRSAVGNDTAAGVFRDAVLRRLVAHVSGQLPGPDRQLRAELAAAHLVGTAMLRYVMRVEPLASADVEQVIRHLVPVVQHHLTGGFEGDVA